MRKRACIFSLLATLAIQVLLPIAPLAAERDAPVKQAGEDRWVPSFVITSGLFIQNQAGEVESYLFEDSVPPPVSLGDPTKGDDLAVAPFVGVAFELMTPALPVRTRPRLFVGAEILPTISTDRDLAVVGKPGCVRRPVPNAPCAADNQDTSPGIDFGEDQMSGQGARSRAQFDVGTYGAYMGVSFPLRYKKRDIRIKPSVAWINYAIDASGVFVDAMCDPTTRCVDSTAIPILPRPGFLREISISGSESKRFNGVGPGLDVEVDTGQFGPLGVSLFAGARAYAILGDRTIRFSSSKSYSDQIGDDVVEARWKVDVNPWMYRVNLGLRLQWLGKKPKP